MFGKPKRISGARRAGLEIALERGDLGGLILQRVEPMRVARRDLDRRDDRRHAPSPSRTSRRAAASL